MSVRCFSEYIEKLFNLNLNVEITSKYFAHIKDKDIKLKYIIDLIIYRTKNQNKKIIIIGNGGSAAIASHTVIDFINACNIKAITLTDMSAITCMANDYGYDQVYSRQILHIAEQDDLLIAISSSGKSKNIINAVKAAKSKGCVVITFSGFNKSNILRKLGDYNIYIPSSEYGMVELSHQMILHSITDSIKVLSKNNHQIELLVHY